MSRDLIAGVFTSVKDQVYVDYLIACGAPEAMAKKYLNTNWRMSISFLEPTKAVVEMSCVEMPEAYLVDTFVEGVEKELDNPALFGGKGKMTFSLAGDNSYKSSFKSEVAGNSEWIEVYSEEGIIFKTTSGAVYDKWTREVKESGWFRFTKEENFMAFNKGLGQPAEFYDSMKNMKVKFSVSGNTVTYIEDFSDMVVNSKFVLDQESDYIVPEIPSLNKKVYLTRLGTGKYLMVAKGNGKTEEWKLSFSGNCLLYEGKDRETGNTCTIWTERFENPYGKYRKLASCGEGALGAAMGWAPEMVAKLKVDFDAVLTFTEKCGVVRVANDSKVFPMDMSYKLNEEFEWKMPGTNDTYKLFETKTGNTFLTIMKGARVTTRSTFVFTDNFAAMETAVVGTGVVAKVVYERF